jgi:hypothetical protein
MWAWVFDSGPANNHSQQASPAQVAQWCRDQGFAWAALEIDDMNFRPSLWWPAFRAECHARGVLAGTWNTEGGNFYKTPADADFTICEIEGPGDYEGLVNVLDGVGAGPPPPASIPRAIITNFNFAPSGAQRLIDEGFSCLTEAYLNEGTGGPTPDNMDALARAYGWTASQAVAGVYPVPGVPLPDYSQWEDWPLAYYLGEYLI